MSLTVASRQFRAGNPPPVATAEKPQCFADPDHLREYLSRHSTLAHTPEGRLMIEVIVVAWRDAAGKHVERRSRAQWFFVSGDADYLGDLIGAPGSISGLYDRHHVKAYKRMARGKGRRR